jgi:hypothetical protein
MEPNCSNYSRDELIESLRTIDKSKYPGRTTTLLNRLKKIDTENSENTDQLLTSINEKTIKSNTRVSGGIGYLILSCIMFYFVYAAFQSGEVGVYRGEKLVLGEQSFFFYVHVVVLLFLGSICACSSIYYWLKK